MKSEPCTRYSLTNLFRHNISYAVQCTRVLHYVATVRITRYNIIVEILRKASPNIKKLNTNFHSYTFHRDTNKSKLH